MKIVLYMPEIPQNTGNICRTCAATGTELILVEPLGFSLADKYLKRAGMDYFKMVNMRVVPDFETVLREHPNGKFHFASTKAPRSYAEVQYGEDDLIVFGSESRGLPENMLSKRYEDCIRIPMRREARSLNLSVSCAVVLFEALRQQDFKGLKSTGELTGREEENAPWLDYL